MFCSAKRTTNPGEPAAGIAAVEVALYDLLDDRPEKTVRPARNGPHTQSGTCRNDGKAPGRGRSAPDVEDDRLPPWREKGLKKRAKVANTTASPWKDTMRPGPHGGIKLENVNRR